jgi:hypothetical protein
MALVCTVPTSSLNPFTFVECSSVNISYDVRGLATVSFTVVSTSSAIELSDYTTISFGSNNSTRNTGSFTAGRIIYKGIITNYELSPIAGTVVYEHRLQMLAWGCK